ncbi:hypothetical protein ABID29_001638 [Streptococcus rupicaprae]|uniref:Uncharacterized protein n=1 Tax=Streptococcus rupicaprae TaxID=759619 RepID=A0ABV2FIY9_9STRE
MIVKKEGSINQIVYKHTVYYEGKYRFYPTLLSLFNLLDELLIQDELPRYISIIPFYKNAQTNGWQEEFDFGGFYIECRDNVSDEEAEKFWLENKFWGWPGAEYNLLDNYVTDEDLKRSNFLVQYGDIDSFRSAILTYKQFLMERGIPQMMKWLYELCDLKDEDLPYGYFCFEVNSD